MAIPAYDSAGAGISGTGSLSVPYPSTVSAGDLLVLHCGARNTGDTFSTPSGWSLLDDQNNTFAMRSYVFTKIADGSETGSLSVTHAGGNLAAARMYRFTGVASSSYTEGLSNAGIGDTGSTVVAPTVTTTGTDRLALALVFTNTPSAHGSFTGETGGDWTEAVAEFTDATSPLVCLQLQTAQMASAGTITGGSLNNTDGSQYLSIGVALVPGGGSVDATVSMTGIRATGTGTPTAPPRPRPAHPYSEVNLRM